MTDTAEERSVVRKFLEFPAAAGILSAHSDLSAHGSKVCSGPAPVDSPIVDLPFKPLTALTRE